MSVTIDTVGLPPDPTVTSIAEEGSAYVLVIGPGGSRRQILSASGRLTIGRADDCEIVVDDPSVSRRHAALELTSAGAAVIDLGSHNGTRVNGNRVEDRSPIVSGDVIAVGAAVLVPYLGHRVGWRGGLDEPSRALERLAIEVDRAGRFGRPLTLLLVELGEQLANGVLALLSPVLRPCDVVGRLGASQLLVIFPELPTRDGEAASQRVISALAVMSPRAVGMAVYPADGGDAGALLTAAREAARPGGGARLQRAEDTGSTLTIGGRAVVVADPGLRRVYELLRRLAPSPMPVLLLGETGVGKEVAAHALHDWSARATGGFVAVNCAALPDNLVESELFGYRKGAFSGADRDKPGFFEAASGGTLFLDEVAELPLAAQAKLLRVLDAGEVTRLGAVVPTRVDVRVVAATNRDLAAAVARGSFRDDLYYRLNGAVVVLPPLRDRPRDVPVLARAFLRESAVRAGRPQLTLSDESLRLLTAHRFPGNVRELARAMEYAATVAHDAVVEPWHLPPAFAPPGEVLSSSAPVDGSTPSSLRPIAEEVAELERRRMSEALAAAGGNQSRAADMIGMPHRTFQTKLGKYGLRKSS